MGVLRHLQNRRCWRCEKKGHACQAQMLDAEGFPVCLRCADGEPCIFVTAAGVRDPKKWAEEEEEMLRMGHPEST